jgi:hypothetical protein
MDTKRKARLSEVQLLLNKYQVAKAQILDYLPGDNRCHILVEFLKQHMNTVAALQKDYQALVETPVKVWTLEHLTNPLHRMRADSNYWVLYCAR